MIGQPRLARYRTTIEGARPRHLRPHSTDRSNSGMLHRRRFGLRGWSWTDGAGRSGFEGRAVLDLAAISRDGMMVMGPGSAVANWEPAIAPAALAAAVLAIP